MTVIYVLLCIICAALTGLVLIQDSKSGGLGGITGSSTMASLGANTDKTIVKITGVCAFLFFSLILMTHLVERSNQTYDSLMGEEVKKEITEGEKKKDSNSPIKTEDNQKLKIKDTKDTNSKEGTSVVVPIPTSDDKPKKDIEEKTVEKKSEGTDKKVDEPKKEEDSK